MASDKYNVGYGKPPKETRFTKGKSGNPKGRPAGSKNLAATFFKICGEEIKVTERGRIRTMKKGDAILHQLVNKAASGDRAFMRDYFQAYKLFQPSESTEEIVPDLSDRDEKIKANFLKRMERMGKENSEDPSSPSKNQRNKETK